MFENLLIGYMDEKEKMKYRFVIFVGRRTNAGECLKILNTTDMLRMLVGTLKGVIKNEQMR